MKIIKQAAIIFSIYSISYIISKFFNLPIPGSVIGMALLFILLYTKVIKEHHIDDVSSFLISNMSLFYVPDTLAIIEEYEYLKDEVISFVTICVFMVIIIMLSTGWSAQVLEKVFNKMRRKKK